MINFIILFPWLDNSPSPQIWVHLFSETIWRSRIHNNTSENLKAFSISTFFLIRVVYFISITVLLQSVTYACWSQCNLNAFIGKQPTVTLSTGSYTCMTTKYVDELMFSLVVLWMSSCVEDIIELYIFLDPCLFKHLLGLLDV